MTITKTAPETCIPSEIAYRVTRESGDTYDVDVQTTSNSKVDGLLARINSSLSDNLRSGDTESGDSYAAEVEANYIAKRDEKNKLSWQLRQLRFRPLLWHFFRTLAKSGS